MKKKNYFILSFIIPYFYLFSQNKMEFSYKYNQKGTEITTAFSEKLGVLYKSNASIGFKKNKKWYHNKKQENYFFSELIQNSENTIIIDFYIVNKSFLTDEFYFLNKLKPFEATFGDSIFAKNYFISYSSKNKEYFISEYFYEIAENKCIRLVTTSTNKLDKNFITEKKLFIGLSYFINKFKERPGKIHDLLDVFFEKDYTSQIEIIKKIEEDPYHPESMYSGILEVLHTNEGSFQKIIKTIKKRRKREIDTSKTMGLIEKVNRVADTCNIMMFNEFHVFPHTRFNFMYVLQDLKKSGYNYLALETLPAPNNTNPIFIENEEIRGYYVEEPTCSLMINYAASLGFKLVAYEEEEQCIDIKEMIPACTCRDSIQALNLSKVYELDKNAKLVVFAGHAHIEKKIREDWKFMRVALQELLPSKKIFSIDQTKYIRTNMDSVDIALDKPAYYDEDNGQFDGQIISPFYEKYYDWYYKKTEIMNKAVQIDSKKDFFSVEILPIQNEKELYIPIFRCKKEDLQSNTIYLPETMKYEIVYKNKNNKKI